MTAYNLVDHNKRWSALLVIGHILVLVSLGWVIGLGFENGVFGVMLAILVAAVSSLVGYFAGDSIALAASGAHEVAKQDAPELYRLTENLAITAGLPMPKLHLINDSAPNAFATGRSPETSSIAVTTGLLNLLDRSELEGVIAHELAHVKNYDIRLMTLTAVLVGSVVLISEGLLRGLPFRDRDSREGNAGAVLLVVTILVAILSPIIAQLIKFAISRSREYLADASAVLLTRYPDGLASALTKIAQLDQPMQRANHATAHLFLANPFDPHVTSRFERFWSTHPPIEDRIAKLKGTPTT